MGLAVFSILWYLIIQYTVYYSKVSCSSIIYSISTSIINNNIIIFNTNVFIIVISMNGMCITIPALHMYIYIYIYIAMCVYMYVVLAIIIISVISY